MGSPLSTPPTQKFRALLRESVREVVWEEARKRSLVRTVHLVRKILIRGMRGTRAQPGNP